MADDEVGGNLQFGPFELSNRQRLLRRDGLVVPLGSRALDILIYLAERPGEVIAKRKLIAHVWSGVTVEEGNLRVHVAAIRKALGDGQFGNRYIANIKGRGYAFVCAVVSLDERFITVPGAGGIGKTTIVGAVGRARKTRADLEQELKACRREIADARERLDEAAKQQSATSEMLRLIANSPIQAMLDAVAENAARLLP